MEEIKQAFTTPDGKVFESKADALEYLNRPKVEKALKALTKNSKVVAFLLDNEEVIKKIFNAGTPNRVKKTEKNQLIKALETVKEELNNNKTKFLVENAEAIAESFRWPSVKRMTSEEQYELAVNSITAISGGSAKIAEWVLENKEELLEAYKASKPVRPVSQKAMDALKEYHLKRAAEKEKGTPTNSKKTSKSTVEEEEFDDDDDDDDDLDDLA